jgi:diguanylate cyclase (GGDEF)-like protein
MTDHPALEQATATADLPLGTSSSDDPLRGALIDSRQRWRDLVAITADLAFETDAWGRFVFITPDDALGWSTGLLLGQPSTLLLADAAADASFNPFRTTAIVRRRRVWLRRGDGGLASMMFAAAPLLDPAGCIVGARGLGIDMTGFDQQGAHIAAALRRGELLDHILWRVAQEVLAPRMMQAALEALVNALGAEGSGVVMLGQFGQAPVMAHEAGRGADDILSAAASLLETDADAAPRSAPGARPLLVTACQTRFGDRAGLTIWRVMDARDWDEEDKLLVAAAASIVRMVLEHEAIQREMARQARTDPLTGLLNRRAFLEEVERRIDRLDREGLPGTLMFADLDNFKPVNDLLGHEMGDQVLVHAAVLLRRAVRPADLVARLGGDEFAVWLDGADHLTAAERAEHLRETVPGEMASIAGPGAPILSMSIGIAERRPGGEEAIDAVMRRSDQAMYDVKRNGRAHWRVSLREEATS